MFSQLLRRFSTSLKDKLPKHKYLLDPKSYRLAHPVYSIKDIKKVPISHYQPQNIRDRVAYYTIKVVRSTFDFFSMYDPKNMGEKEWLNRIIFLETVAGVPGLIGGMCRHLRSLRTMQHDNGWIHHLLEQAQNERMHLFTALELKQPGPLFKGTIFLSQGVFFWGFGLMYLLSPKMAHRFVGYLQEEAVKTYTKCLQSIESGKLKKWKQTPASSDAIKYWHLPEDATMRQVIMAIRADQVVHRQVNHHFASLPINAKMEHQEIFVDDECQSNKKEEGKQKN